MELEENLNMCMLHSQKVKHVPVEICHPKKDDFPNVEYHVAAPLMNIAEATRIKPIGFRLDLDLRVSLLKWDFLTV